MKVIPTILENAVFMVQFMAIMFIIFSASYAVETRFNIAQGSRERILTTKKIVIIGLFSAISSVLMMFEVPLPFAPGFYKIDFSEVPVLVVAFAYGPVAGVLTEFCKIVLKLVFRSTNTAFVGELANFVVGCSLILPAAFIYLFHKSRHYAIVGCITGALCMTAFGSVFNAAYLLPKFAQLYGISLDKIVAMGSAINPAITSVQTLVLFATVPFNIVKGIAVSGITVVLYKKLSIILRRQAGIPAQAKAN